MEMLGNSSLMIATTTNDDLIRRIATAVCQYPSVPSSASNDDENDAQDRRRTMRTAKKSFTHAIGNL